jgi:hypothetical protein
MKTEDLSLRITHLIEKGNVTLASKYNTASRTNVVKDDLRLGFRSAGLSFIKTLYGSDHPYYSEFEESLNGYYATNVAMGIEILKSIKHEIDNGWLSKLTMLVTADVFSDFLDMAEHLLKENYKDAAAVIAGSVFEDMLRKLASVNGIPTTNDKGKPMTMEPINIELAKKDVFNQLVKKQNTAWADLRNNAAHGNYDEYNEQQVKDMIIYVTGFASTYLI